MSQFSLIFLMEFIGKSPKILSDVSRLQALFKVRNSNLEYSGVWPWLKLIFSAFWSYRMKYTRPITWRSSWKVWTWMANLLKNIWKKDILNLHSTIRTWVLILLKMISTNLLIWMKLPKYKKYRSSNCFYFEFEHFIWYNAYYIVSVVEREKVQSGINLSKIA